MREALKFVGGSFVVYVVMAACSGKLPQPEAAAFTRPSSGGASATQGDVPGLGGLAEMAGETSATGQMGASGQESGVGGTRETGGNGPRDAGVMDAMAGAVTDPVPDAAAQEMGGSRLKARYLVGEDGSKQFAGWYDSQRKENCTVMSASDGTLRCLPTVSASGGSYFSDSNCSSPLFVTVKVTGNCPAGAANTYGYTATTCSGYTVYSLTATTPTMVYTGTPGACNGSTAPTTLSFFTGTEVGLSSFVKATEQVE